METLLSTALNPKSINGLNYLSYRLLIYKITVVRTVHMGPLRGQLNEMKHISKAAIVT